MTKRIDYSVWDNIEVSDDEDDTHPNVDTPSLFRWRHQARLDRMEKASKEKEDLEKQKNSNLTKKQEIKKKLEEAETKSTPEDLSKMKLELGEIEKQERDYRKKEAELKHKEKMTPWNIDTICTEGKSKTIINSYKSSEKKLSDEEVLEKQEKFRKENESLLKKFGMLRKYDDSQELLLEHPHLASEETANYLVLWCINLEVQEKHDLMAHVANQAIVMQFILELARSLETNPKNCIKAFFSRIKLAEKQYMDAFNDELEAFKTRVRDRAQARLDQAIQEVEEEERQKRLGPGGLDPVEVFESLPKILQDCFESKDIAALQSAIITLPKEEAQFHMDRCVKSGLWVPGPDDHDDKPQSEPTNDDQPASSS